MITGAAASVPDTRTRLLAAARDLAAQRGWSNVRMGHIAASAHVSRQTVYNEFGSKPALAAALVASELTSFLAGVQESLDAHEQTASSVHAAISWVLEHASTHPVLVEIRSTRPGVADGLLPHLSTHAATLVDTTAHLIDRWIAQRAPQTPPATAAWAADTIVRLCLSHVLLPSPMPDAAEHLTAVFMAAVSMTEPAVAMDCLNTVGVGPVGKELA